MEVAVDEDGNFPVRIQGLVFGAMMFALKYIEKYPFVFDAELTQRQSNLVTVTGKRVVI